MSLDHGILNTPLSKRGDIDAQIDRYKRDRGAVATAARKAKAAEMRELKGQAKQALAVLKADVALLDAKAAKLGVTRPKLVAQLTDWSKWQPRELLHLRGQWAKADAAEVTL